MESLTHRAGAAKWNIGLQKMFDVFPSDCKYIGLSATPIRYLDGKRNMAEELFNGCVANEINLADAIIKRILPLPRYIAGLYTYENEVDAIIRKIQKSYNYDEEKKELLEEVAIMKRNLDKGKGVSSIFKKYIDGEKGKYIAFCRNITHLQEMKVCLAEWFSEAGITVNLYEVHCKNLEKNEQFQAFMNDDELAVCLSVGMLAEGIHGIDGVILLRDTISANLYYQQIGRAFAVGMKTIPLIIDLVANCDSVMDCSLKNDLLESVEKQDKEKAEMENGDGTEDEKEITKEDIESFFIFDNVIDAVNAFKSIEGRLQGREWTEEEDEIMYEFYTKEGGNICKRLPQRTKRSCVYRAKKLGISNSNKYSEEEIEKFESLYLKYGLDCVKYFPGRTKGNMGYLAHRLSVKRNNSYAWSKEEVNILKEKYPYLGTKCIEFLPNKTKQAIKGYARRLGIKKEKGCKKYKYVFLIIKIIDSELL